MNIIKLDAIDSTNNYLKKLMVKNELEDCTVVSTNFQYAGKGQMGSEWYSEKSKNLICSILKQNFSIKLKDQFLISIVVSLSILKSLQKFNIPNLTIKWPNDIMSVNKKICGVLIENIIKNNLIQSSVIGIGLNINQKYFENLPSASSMKNITGTHYDINEILTQILIELKNYFSLINELETDKILELYTSKMYRINKPSTFKLISSNEIFSGFIKGINRFGEIIIELEDNIIKTYKLKQVILIN